VSRIAWITLSAAAVALLAAGCEHGSATTATDTTSNSPTQLFSLPLAQEPSTLALAKHSGTVLVGLAARPGGPVEVAVLRGETPVAGDALDLQFDGEAVEAQSCGRGCSRIEADVLGGSPKRLTVRAGSATASFDLPARLPPSGAGLFARAQKTMSGLHSFRFKELLTSGVGGLVSEYDVQAPNRLRLHTSGGYRSVIIGHTRWDYHDGRWERGPFPGLTLAGTLMWSRAEHARIIGRRANGDVDLVAFGLQPVPAWFRLTVGPDGRVGKMEMIAASHFMVHTYSDFNGRFSIEPPKK